MDKTYKSEVVRREPRPRSKRLRESGQSVAGNVSITVNNNGESTGTGSENGHIHSNFSMLESLSADGDNYVYRTIPVEGEDDTVTQQTEKIKSGFADKAGELDEEFITDVLRKLFLSKDRPDETKHLLKLLGGVKIGKNLTLGEFITGVSGGYIDEKGDGELNSLYLRDHLSVPEIRFNRMTYFEGYNVISPGGGVLIREVVDNKDGSYTVTPDYEEGEPCGVFKDDIYTGYYHNLLDKTSDIKGFSKVQYRVTSVDYDARTAVLTPKQSVTVAPCANMRLGQTGNFTNAERQTYIIIDTRDGNCCMTFFDDANTWDPEPAQMKSWFGKKKGMMVNGISCDNYSAVLQNIIMTGLIFQVDEVTGQSVRVPVDFEEWDPNRGKPYPYYARLPHNGSTWLCVNPAGSSTEPSETNPDWLCVVAKGKDGLSVVGGGHWEAGKIPYKANTMVTLANCVFISKVETSNPPIRIARFKGGSFVRKKDGGYILAGKPADWQVHPDWDMYLDARELKGEGITFLGEYISHPADPKEGDSYRNTKDMCTYIYRNGVWQVMTKDGTDGKDGRDYEWIYQRGNIIGNPPPKPDSVDEDDAVPAGWTDDFLGVDADHQIEWGCKRVKRDGHWQDWSEPAIVHRWSKDGESAVFADLDNQMDSVALTHDGKTVQAASWTITASMWYGTRKLTFETLSCVPVAGISVQADKATGRITVSVPEGIALDESNVVRVTMSAIHNGTAYSREVVFTLAGVRAGVPGSDGGPGKDAVLYRLVPSATYISKDKTGQFSAAEVSCRRQKSVGGVISDTTDGELKHSIDGGAEVAVGDGVAVATSKITRSIRFAFYVGGKLVDVETIPMVVDGIDGQDGKPGKDGVSVEGGGPWESAKVPYRKNSMVTMANCAFLAKVETSNPPLAVARFKGGSFIRKKGGGYILAGKSSDFTVHPDWDMLIDGRELKGDGYHHLGEYASQPASPKEGDTYRNTTDGCTYIFRAGIWELFLKDGTDGKDADTYEYIYMRNNDTANVPPTPDSTQKDDAVPAGWTDDFLGVDADHQIEWGCKRRKRDGIWGAWSTPAVVHRWSKDGESVIFADIDNEMESIALTADGKVKEAVSITANVSVWCGLTKLSLSSLTASDAPPLTVQVDKATGRVTVNAAKGASLPDRMRVIITASAQFNGQNYSRDIAMTIVGVRAGAAGQDGQDGNPGKDGEPGKDGQDAVLYRLVPSATYISKDKTGQFSAAEVSCRRQKSVGGVISDTTDGELKYSIDGGTEVAVGDGVAVATSKITRSIKFAFYVDSKLVDVETIPMVVDGIDGQDGEPGKDGTDGSSIELVGRWEASKAPYHKGNAVKFARRVFVAKKDVYEPPLPIMCDVWGYYRRVREGGYILAGKSGDALVPNEGWELMVEGAEETSYWLDCPVAAIHFTATGTPSPHSFVVALKQSAWGNVSSCGKYYLAARKYNGSWLPHVAPVQAMQLSVTAAAGYTQFAVRAYKTAAAANAWGDDYIAEKGIGVAVDGADGKPGEQGPAGSFPRDRGVFASGSSYVWNPSYRDKVIHMISGVYYNFLVKNFGATVTAAPTSANGDANWEVMNKFVNIATDTLFADGANVAGFMFKSGMLKSQNEGIELSGKKGDAYIKLGSGKVLLKEDGSGKLANGNVYWDANGNTTFNGNIVNTSKSISNSGCTLISSVGNVFKYRWDGHRKLTTGLMEKGALEEILYLPSQPEEGADYMVVNLCLPPYSRNATSMRFTAVCIDGKGEFIGGGILSEDVSSFKPIKCIRFMNGFLELTSVKMDGNTKWIVKSLKAIRYSYEESVL